MGVRWRKQCPPTWPNWARDWAKTRGSLTRRLSGLGHGFEVQAVYQGATPVIRAKAPPECNTPGWMRQRLVRLRVGGQAMVLAQTLLKIDGPVNDWHFWRALGNRSLGSVLFSDPGVKRGRLYFARLPAHEPWVLALLGEQAAGHARAAGTDKVWYARCSRFSRGRGRTPLWVMEVFLPQLEIHL
jgi:chorismate lyase